MRRNEEAPADAADGAAGPAVARDNEVTELKTLVGSLNARIDALEGRLQTMNDKFDHVGSRPKVSAVNAHPSDAVGVDVQPIPAPKDPEAGFVNDNAVSAFREGMILFTAQKYPEAILGFSAFLERFADHPMAGSAQYYIAEAYYQQKEYSLALNEYQRVLTSYDRSPRVADCLGRMASIEDNLKKPGEAAKHRLWLSSMFPSAPAGLAGPALKTDMRVETHQAATSPPRVQAKAPAKTEAPVISERPTEEAPPSSSAAPKERPTNDRPADPTRRPILDEPPPTAPVAPEQGT